MSRRPSELHQALETVSPGTPLREGLDRIVRASMGALVVLGDGPDVLNICSGGFLLDAPYSPQRLSELAKMDGAIIVAADAGRIARANVHLVPDPNTPTSETGTRHRTAERVARSINVPVVSVSEDMSVIAVYVNNIKHVIEETPRLLNRANQAMQTLERYKTRLDHAAGALTALEVEDVVTVRDVVTLLQRSEMVRRIADEIETYTVELGNDARLIRLQHDELMNDTDDDRFAVISDYVNTVDGRTSEVAMAQLAALSTDDVLDLTNIVTVLGLPNDLDNAVTPRGFRLLRQLPLLPNAVADRIASRYGNLAHVQRASADELAAKADVDTEVAEAVKGGLARLTETSILERYT
jgi:diadenylate cyclase